MNTVTFFVLVGACTMIITNQGYSAGIAPIIKIGHRGACGYEPENTLSSFAKALELGVDMVELDVHICATGELVVIHDITVNRTTNGTGKVSKKTLQELQSLSIRSSQHIPTLEQVCDLINRRVPINIELKGYNTAVPTAKLIQYYVTHKKWSYSDFRVSSFNHPEVMLFHELCPQVPFGPILQGILPDYAAFAQRMGAHFLVVAKDFLTPAYVQDAHIRGIPVFAYTANRPEDIAKLKRIGVDGIFSDFPDRLQA